MGYRYFVFLWALLLAPMLYGEESFPETVRIPDEYEAAGGHSLGFGHGGAAALSGLSALRVNPAMMALESEYVMSTGYHWPSFGREFYQAGVVDSKTSPVAAGASYTGFMDKLEKEWQKERRVFDSPVTERIGVGFAKVASKVALGVSGHFIKALKRTDTEISMEKGLTLGLGVAGLITKQIRFGLSAENLNNKPVKDFAPRVYRAGLAYMADHGNITAHLDFRRRERVALFEMEPSPVFFGLKAQPSALTSKPEDMVIASFSGRIYNLLRIIGAYGKVISQGDTRETLSGGLAIVQNHYSLSYNVSKPYLSESEVHSNLNLNFTLSL